jgi:hypothetical protein
MKLSELFAKKEKRKKKLEKVVRKLRLSLENDYDEETSKKVTLAISRINDKRHELGYFSNNVDSTYDNY